MTPRPPAPLALRAGSRPRSVAALLLAVLLAALLPGPSRADGTAAYGSEGIGDPYFPLDGNGGIDVQHYDVHDSYLLPERWLSGWTRLTVRATDTLAGFQLDFLLPVQQVLVDGTPVDWSRPEAHELRITAAVDAGSTHEVLVRYAGRPDAVGWDGERNWLADSHEVVTMNQPHMAAWWFPADDHPQDKATMDVHVTAARGLDVIANGRRVSRSVHGRLATTHWRSVEPMAPYLAFFAAGHFEVRHGSDHGLPWLVAVSEQIPSATRRRSMRLMLRTPAIVHWLQGELGRYPFSSTGGLTTGLSPGFALENQTRPTYPVLGSAAVTTEVHELAHQWFGDSVAVQDWRDIWLNEGAATFMEARYAETHGRESAQAWLEGLYDDNPDGSAFWDLDVADPGPDHLFDWQVYQRGGMTLQALRHRIGDDAFWRLLRAWVHDRRGGNGSTEDFVALAGQVSGEDLTGFFQAWLRDPARPARTRDNGLR